MESMIPHKEYIKDLCEMIQKKSAHSEGSDKRIIQIVER